MQATSTVSLRDKFHFRKIIFLSICLIVISFASYAQLSVSKMIGKNSSNSTLGYGLFTFLEFPTNDIGNRNVMIELMDLVFFPPKDDDLNATVGYLSIKAGYKYIFSEETTTGFYVEPSVGFVRVVTNQDDANGKAIFGDGLALATEVGYTVEVGQKGNNVNFGLKYETDRPGAEITVSSIAFRVSYSFHWIRNRKNQ